MKTQENDIITRLTNGHTENEYLTTATIPYTRSKEEMWGEMEAWMSTRDVKTHGRASQLSSGRASIMISAMENDKSHGWRHLETHGRASLLAASVIILLGIAGFLHFYTKTINAGNGQHLTVNLPDQSTVTLNAHSTLKYHPYRWFLSRKVEFSGEGFFEVSKGRKFEVSSSNGKTIVLGTSFNIFSREADYKVTCFTGKVKVVSPSSEEAILAPDFQATVGADGAITVVKLEQPGVVTTWKDDMFSFTSAPLQAVIDEIERQYDVKVEIDVDDQLVYTGHFSKGKPVEEVLSLICKPFGLTFVKKSDKQYLISQP